jgi:hypothetical protein
MEDYIFCTNGQRLHLLDMKKYLETGPVLDTGIWGVIKHNTKEIIINKTNDKESEDIKIPWNLKSIISPLWSEEEIVIESRISDSYGVSIILSDIYEKRPGLCLNIPYIQDVFKCGDSFSVYGKHEPPVYSPFVFKNKETGKYALVMPIRKRNNS